MHIDEMNPARIEELYAAACEVRHRAYAPYSSCLVGAAILCHSGEIYRGCNVENASYGATICAERMAIGAAVSGEGTPQIRAVMIVTDAETPWPPCGLCRQVIAEFSTDCQIFCANLQGKIEKVSFADLYPQAFTPIHLKS
jgi:cytidine deaminase